MLRFSRAKIIFCGFIFAALGNSDERLVSLIKPTIPGTTIANAHMLTPKLFRGMAPTGDEIAFDLQRLKVTDLIDIDWTSKDAPSWDVDNPYNPASEKALAEQQGFKFAPSGKASQKRGKHFYIISTMWNNLHPFTDNCRAYVKVLRVLKAVVDDPVNDRKAFFHCTVGEDRTGVVAGLYRMLAESWTLRNTFNFEMCQFGYEGGDPKKSADAEAFDRVIVPIRKELTPFFLKMAYKVESGALSWSTLSDAACDKDPDDVAEYVQNPRYFSEAYTCERSPLSK